MISVNLTPCLSILIPTRNNEKDLIDCLNSIGSLDYPSDKIEIIIWDNNSGQEGKEKVKDFLSNMTNEKSIRIEFIEHNDNYGVYTSRDELFKHVDTNTEYILSLDDDVVLPIDGLTKMLKVFRQFPVAGVVGPRVVYYNHPEETQHGAGFVNLWLGKYSEIDSSKLIECDYTIGCCQLMRKEVADRLQGFDRDYYTSHGEVDFCLKTKKIGYKVFYQPEVVVKHKVDKGGTRTMERLYYLYRNKLLVIKKNATFLQKITSLVLYSIFWIPKILLDCMSFNKGVNIDELRVIFKGIYHGTVGKKGKL